MAVSVTLQANWPGVVIAVVLVIGTIIIVPWIASKLAGTGSSSYLNLGGYGRSEDGQWSHGTVTDAQRTVSGRTGR